jgi:DNA gyrase subunit A
MELLVVTDGGFGKRTALGEFPRKGRGTMGVRGMKIVQGRGAEVVAAAMVTPADEVILISSSGVLIRTAVADIARQGRTASGVRVMAVSASETVSALALAPTLDFDDGDGDEIDHLDGSGMVSGSVPGGESG